MVEIGEPIPLEEKPSFARKGKLTPIWPIDKDGNDRCWRSNSTSMRRLLGEGRLVVGQQNQKTKSWTLNIWDPK